MSKVTDINSFRELKEQLDEEAGDEQSEVDKLAYTYLQEYFEELMEDFDDGSADPHVIETEEFQRVAKWNLVLMQALGNKLAPNASHDDTMNRIFESVITVVDDAVNAIIENIANEDEEDEEPTDSTAENESEEDDLIETVLDRVIRILIDNEAIQQAKQNEEEDED